MFHPYRVIQIKKELHPNYTSRESKKMIFNSPDSSINSKNRKKARVSTYLNSKSINLDSQRQNNRYNYQSLDLDNKNCKDKSKQKFQPKIERNLCQSSQIKVSDRYIPRSNNGNNSNFYQSQNYDRYQRNIFLNIGKKYRKVDKKQQNIKRNRHKEVEKNTKQTKQTSITRKSQKNQDDYFNKQFIYNFSKSIEKQRPSTAHYHKTIQYAPVRGQKCIQNKSSTEEFNKYIQQLRRKRLSNKNLNAMISQQGIIDGSPCRFSKVTKQELQDQEQYQKQQLQHLQQFYDQFKGKFKKRRSLSKKNSPAKNKQSECKQKRKQKIDKEQQYTIQGWYSMDLMRDMEEQNEIRKQKQFSQQI